MRRNVGAFGFVAEMNELTKAYQLTCIESHICQAISLMRALDDVDREGCKAVFEREYMKMDKELKKIGR